MAPMIPRMMSRITPSPCLFTILLAMKPAWSRGQGSNPLNSWRFHDACQTSAVAGIGGISILDLIGQRPKIRGRGD